MKWFSTSQALASARTPRSPARTGSARGRHWPALRRRRAAGVARRPPRSRPALKATSATIPATRGKMTTERAALAVPSAVTVSPVSSVSTGAVTTLTAPPPISPGMRFGRPPDPPAPPESPPPCTRLRSAAGRLARRLGAELWLYTYQPPAAASEHDEREKCLFPERHMRHELQPTRFNAAGPPIRRPKPS